MTKLTNGTNDFSIDSDGKDKNGSVYVECELGAACDHTQAPDGATVWHDEAHTETLWVLDPRADWDDSDYIDIIESAKAAWFASSPCITPTDDDTDAAINRQLFAHDGPCTHHAGLAGELADQSEDDIREAVRIGLSNWYGTVDTSAVELYDQMDAAARAEYRENTAVGFGDCELSLATLEQLNAIDAGRKAPSIA